MIAKVERVGRRGGERQQEEGGASNPTLDLNFRSRQSMLHVGSENLRARTTTSQETRRRQQEKDDRGENAADRAVQRASFNGQTVSMFMDGRHG